LENFGAFSFSIAEWSERTVKLVLEDADVSLMIKRKKNGKTKLTHFYCKKEKMVHEKGDSNCTCVINIITENSQ